MSDDELTVDQEEGIDVQGDADAEELSDEEKFKAKLKESIVVEREEIGALRQKLTVTVPRETLDDRLSYQFAELKRDALVPGFRKGHAPLKLVEKRFAADVGEQLSSEIISGAYMAAVEKEELKPLGDPLFWVKVPQTHRGQTPQEAEEQTEKLLAFDKALDHLALPNEGPLTFACEVELKPEFELPELTKIPLERPVVSIEDADVDAQITRLCAVRGKYRPVEEGTVEPDDLLYLDITMSVDGTVVDSEQNAEIHARDSVVMRIPMIGLGAALVGKSVGEQATLEATVPDDYDDINLRGKTAVFEFTICEMKRFELPPLDADFLANIGCESEEELRTEIRSDLEARLDREIRRAMHRQIGQYLVDNTTLEIPEGLSHRQVERSITRRKLVMMQTGIPEAEIDKSMDEMRAKAHDQVLWDLKVFFILERIAEERDITVSEERLNSAIAQIAQQANKRFDRVRDELSKSDGLLTLYLQLRDEQILDSLVDEAEITEHKVTKKKTTRKKGTKRTKKATTKKSPESE
ncbi:MAG: trigger factor [Phycisphaerae bacterium]